VTCLLNLSVQTRMYSVPFVFSPDTRSRQSTLFGDSGVSIGLMYPIGGLLLGFAVRPSHTNLCTFSLPFL
jgi:hypothetical protein